MAQSRLEKIGTIYSRVTGLLRSGAMKPGDKPLWYDLYEAFPPKLEPRFDRPAPQIEIRNILYEEDKVRAKYHKSVKQQGMLNLLDRQRETQTQQFIKIYQGLKSQGALDEEKIFETSLDLLQQQREQMKSEIQEAESTENEEKKLNLTASFIEAKSKKIEHESHRKDTKTKPSKENAKNTIGGINIENLFKD